MHYFSFGNLCRWDVLVAASAFAHQGKHTPLLLIEDDFVPPVVIDYLQFLKPSIQMPPTPPFMHGFILGTPYIVHCRTQAELEKTLKFDEQANDMNTMKEQ